MAGTTGRIISLVAAAPCDVGRIEAMFDLQLCRDRRQQQRSVDQMKSGPGPRDAIALGIICDHAAVLATAAQSGRMRSGRPSRRAHHRAEPVQHRFEVTHGQARPELTASS